MREEKSGPQKAKRDGGAQITRRGGERWKITESKHKEAVATSSEPTLAERNPLPGTFDRCPAESPSIAPLFRKTGRE